LILPNWTLKLLYSIVICLLLTVLILSLFSKTRELANEIANPLLTGALALSTLMLAIFAERQASAAEKKLQRAESIEKANRDRYFYEKGPKPSVKFVQERNTLGVLWNGVNFYNFGTAETYVINLYINNFDVSEKVIGRKIPANITSGSSSNLVRLFDNNEDEYFKAVLDEIESEGSFLIKLVCTSPAFPNDKIITMQTNYKDKETGNWINGEPWPYLEY